MNNTTKLLAFTLAFGSMALCSQLEAHAQEQQPIVQISEGVNQEQQADETTPVHATNNATSTENEEGQKTNDTTSNENVEQNTSNTTNTDQGQETKENDEPTGQISNDGDEIQYNVKSDVNKDNKLTNLNETFTSKNTNETLQVIGHAISDKNKENLLKVLEKCYRETTNTNMGNEMPVKLVNGDFIDTGKYSLDATHDSNHCWAHAAANVLWNTGWAQEAINPLTKQNFTSADEVAAYFSTYFTDQPSNTDDAFEWFFNGNYFSHDKDKDGVEQSAQLTTSSNKYNNASYGEGVEQRGCLTDYCVDVIKQYIGLKNSNLSDIQVLEKLGKEIGSELGIKNICVDKKTGEQTTNGGHAITVVGVIINPNDTTLNRYKAVIVADSDDNVSDQKSLPDDINQLLSTKSKLVKSYKLYYLGQFTDASGKQWWELKNYSTSNGNKEIHRVIDELCTLKNNTEENRNLARETDKDAKKDTTKFPDLVVTDVATQDTQKNNTTTYKVGDEIVLAYKFTNPSKVNLPSSSEDPQINTVYVYKDGKLLNTIIKPDGSPSSADTSYSDTVKLSDYIAFQPGKYSVKIELNTVGEKGKYFEAYYKNNTSELTYFVVEGDAQQTTTNEVKKDTTKEDTVTQSNDQTPVTEEKKIEQDTDEDKAVQVNTVKDETKGTTSTTTNKSNAVNTGVVASTGLFATLMVAAGGAIAACFKRKK